MNGKIGAHVAVLQRGRVACATNTQYRVICWGQKDTEAPFRSLDVARANPPLGSTWVTSPTFPTSDSHAPSQVDPPDVAMQSIDAGCMMFCGISREAGLHCWGFINKTMAAERDFDSGLGHAPTPEKRATISGQWFDTVPPYNKALASKKFSSVAVGHGCQCMDGSEGVNCNTRIDTACATQTNGKVLCFAGQGMKVTENVHGRKGPATHIIEGVPERVKFRSGSIDIYNELDNGWKSPQYACGE